MNEPDLLAEIESYAVAIAGKAGEILLSQFRRPLAVEFKDKRKRDPVTAADHQSDEYLRAAIKERFREHGIVSEEGEVAGDSGSPFTWVLDPLDGTINFMNGLPLFAVSVGVLRDGRPVAGAIFTPVTHKATAGVYHARLGNGAWLNDEKLSVLTAPSGRPLTAMPMSGPFRLTGQSRKLPHESRSTGSIAIDLALAASGVFQYALFGHPRIWDVAAGVLLATEAGGLALTKRKGGRWLPLDRFEPVASEKQTLKGLHDWSNPLLAGSTEAVANAARDMRGPAIWLGVKGWLGLGRGKRRPAVPGQGQRQH